MLSRVQNPVSRRTFIAHKIINYVSYEMHPFVFGLYKILIQLRNLSEISDVKILSEIQKEYGIFDTLLMSATKHIQERFRYD